MKEGVPLPTPKEALADLNRALRELTEFNAEFAPLVEQHTALEADVKNAKTVMAMVLAQQGVDFVEDADIAVSCVRQDRGSYNIERLPKTADVLDACDISISTKAVKQLVRKGLLSEEDAQAAWESAPTQPYVVVKVKTS